MAVEDRQDDRMVVRGEVMGSNLSRPREPLEGKNHEIGWFVQES
jgi:hypothetical protein